MRRGRFARTMAAVAGLAAGLAAHPAFAQGCAMCKRNLEQNGGQGLLDGFYYSIILLLGTPALLVGSVAFLIVRANRKAAREDSTPE